MTKLEQDTMRPANPGKGTGAILYGIFWVILLLPRLQRRRRRPEWRRIQFAAAGVALAVIAVGAALSKLWLIIPGCVLLLLSVAIRRLRDPERERNIQARYGARYFLNGGKLIQGRLPDGQEVPAGEPLYLLLTDQELLFVPVKTGELAATISVCRIDDVRVNGEHYVPVYVSEAKDPPVRDEHVDQSATTTTELLFDNGKMIKLAYSGAFHKHLAETAAHAIYSVKKLVSAESVSGESPEVFHVVGR